MHEVSYINGLLWYAIWPVVIYFSYKFTMMNIEHLENNLEEKEK